jgi:uncharacterized RDD family membrane protein YckC
VAPRRTGRDLPLFGADERTPLIAAPPAPRPPLAVRRATPDPVRLRSEAGHTPWLDLKAPDDDRMPPRPATAPSAEVHAPADGDAGAAPIAARVSAVVIDLLILAVVDLAVVYFTLQICGLSLADLDILPKAPLVAFLVVQNGGYLVTFTAGGQTLGKMASGIRVVAADDDRPLDVTQSLLRTIVWVMLAVPAGLGFVSAFFTRDHRGLHDRCAGTRVVRAA